MVKISEQGIANLGQALAKFQGEVRNPANSAVNPQFRSKYAPLDVVINTVKPVLEKYGLSFIQSTGAVDESIIVTTVLIHESGEYIESDPLVLPAYQLKKGGEKDFNAQGAGSAITYGRRYSLSALLGLSSEDDDDGNNASGYKDSSSNTPKPPTGGGMSDEEKEKKKQEAIAKAQAKKELQSNTQAPKEDNADVNTELILPAQKTAITNLVKILERTKKIENADEYLANLVAVHGAPDLEALTQTQAKAVIQQINEDKKK